MSKIRVKFTDPRNFKEIGRFAKVGKDQRIAKFGKFGDFRDFGGLDGNKKGESLEENKKLL